MKTKLLWVALLAIVLVNNSSWAQDYAGTKTVTSAGNVDLSEWIVPTGQLNQIYLLKIVAEEVEPQLVKTGVNTWTSVNRDFPNNFPNYSTWVNEQWVPNSVPGGYGIYGNGTVAYVASYTSNPWVGVDQTATTGSPHLTSFNGTIVAENYVELKVSDIFANYGVALFKLPEEAPLSRGNIKMQITDSGHYALLTSSGSASPAEIIYFDVVINNTVSEVVVSPQSLYANSGETIQFSATVTGTQPGLANQNVTWAVSGRSSYWTADITQDGLLSIINENAGTVLTVTATSLRDPSKSGTATVIVGSPPPVINYYTVTAHTDPPEAPAVTIYEYIDETTISDGTFEEGQYCSVEISVYSIDDWQQIGWTVNGDTIINDAYGYYHTGNYSFIVTADTEIVAHFTRTTDIPDLSSAPPIARVVIYDLAGKKIIEKQGDTTAGEVSALPAGIYVKKEILETGAVRSRKIVK